LRAAQHFFSVYHGYIGLLQHSLFKFLVCMSFEIIYSLVSDLKLRVYALGSGKPVGWASAHQSMSFILYLTT